MPLVEALMSKVVIILLVTVLFIHPLSLSADNLEPKQPQVYGPGAKLLESPSVAVYNTGKPTKNGILLKSEWSGRQPSSSTQSLLKGQLFVLGLHLLILRRVLEDGSIEALHLSRSPPKTHRQ